MLFNSFSFLVFFAALVVVYYLVPHRLRWILVEAASLYFYATFNFNYVFLLAACTLVAYGAGWAIRSRTLKSRNCGGRPKLEAETVALIQPMAQENRLWGAERIRGELLKLGLTVAQHTIQKDIARVRSDKPASGRNCSARFRVAELPRASLTPNKYKEKTGPRKVGRGPVFSRDSGKSCLLLHDRSTSRGASISQSVLATKEYSRVRFLT